MPAPTDPIERDRVIYLTPESYSNLAACLPIDISWQTSDYKGSNRFFYANTADMFPLVRVIFRPLGAAISDSLPYMDKPNSSK